MKLTSKLKQTIILVLVLGLTLLSVPNFAADAAAGLPVVNAVYIDTVSLPGAANNGTTTTVTINGTNLTGVTGVSFYQGTVLDPLITVTNIVPSATSPDTRFKVDVVVDASSVAGLRNITVTTPSGTSASLNNCFTVYRATVNVSTPGVVPQGGNIWVAVNVTDVANLNSSQFDLSYDPAVVQVTGIENTLGITDGVTGGRIPASLSADNYLQAGWTFQPTPGVAGGAIRVIGHNNGISTVRGSGYLSMINFNVLASNGASSNMTISNLSLFNSNTSRIVTDSITNGSISVGNSGTGVNLSVVLQGGSRPDAGWVVPLSIKFFTPGADVMTATPVLSFNQTSAKSGATAIATAAGVSPGTYDITVRTPTCLTNVKRGIVVTAPSTNVNLGTLLEGDANDSGNINIQDFGILAAAYGKSSGSAGYDARADFDRNGIINIADFGLLAANYGKFSPIAVP